jgi:hypothetical protein
MQATDAAQQTRQRLQEAMLAHDHAAVMALFAPGAVLHSPILRAPFEGRGAVSDVLRAVIDGFDDFRYTAAMGDGDVQMVAFSATVDGEPIDGVDLLHIDADGLIDDVTVYIRPILGLSRVMASLGVPLARRTGPWQERAMRLLGAPLPALLKGGESLVPRLVQLRKP